MEHQTALVVDSLVAIGLLLLLLLLLVAVQNWVVASVTPWLVSLKRIAASKRRCASPSTYDHQAYRSRMPHSAVPQVAVQYPAHSFVCGVPMAVHAEPNWAPRVIDPVARLVGEYSVPMVSNVVGSVAPGV